MENAEDPNAGWCARAVLWLIFLTLPVRLALAAVSGLGYGESYYMLNVLSPQLSYFDQPPLAFWLGTLSVELCGALNALTLRLPSILCFAGITWLMYCLGKKLFGARAGFYAALLLNLSAVFTVTTASWLQPDAPLMLFWLATALCLVRIFRIGGDDPETAVSADAAAEKARIAAARAGSLKWWLLAGLLLGLTTLSKYHAAFLFAGAGLFALTHRPSRHWLWHPGPYLALLVNFIVSSPIFIWNAQNHWASFLFQSARAGSGGEFSLHWDWFLGSLVGQSLWLLPWIWLPLMWLMVDAFRRGPGACSRWFCACTAVLPIVFFSVVTLWSDLGFHFHWQAPGYLMLFPLLGAEAAGWTRSALMRHRVWTRRWLWLSAGACVLVMLVLQLHAATGCWSKFGPAYFAGFFDEEDPTLEGFDYDALRERFAKEGWLDDANVFAAANRWHLGGKMGWALRGKKPVACFDDDPRNLAFLYPQTPLLGKDAVVAVRLSPRKTAKFLDEIRNMFAEITPLEPVKIIRGGKEEFSLQLFYCRKMLKEYAYPENYRTALGGAAE